MRLQTASAAGDCILAVCGFKNSGKTTLVESLVPLLRAEGLRLAVVKHDVHGVDVDHPGKDSDRFFRAGADVVLQGVSELVFRSRPENDAPLRGILAQLASSYDVVLVEGHKGTPLPKIWLDGSDPPAAPAGVENVQLALGPGAGRLARAFAFVKDWAAAAWRAAPVHGCILIGGKSRRMGSPKHLLGEAGETWVERSANTIGQAVAPVVISGEGEMPASLRRLAQLPDVPGIPGPLSGILAAMRWNPAASWLVAACDLPDMSKPALDWLLSFRRPGVWAVLPSSPERPGLLEPLLAYYNRRSKGLLEDLAASADLSLQRLAGHAKVLAPTVPEALRRAFRNVNSADDLGSRA